jgi:hypothetical protein
MGLSSRLIYKCDCQEEYAFDTSENVDVEVVRGQKGKVVNVQAVVEALASGKGLKGLQTQFGSMDVPVMGHDAFDDVMVKVTDALENLSSEAFEAAREEEIRRVQKRWGREPIRVIDSEGKVHFRWPLSDSFDGAWPKRGTRRTGYNSQRGMATIIGTETGWVLDCEI